MPRDLVWGFVSILDFFQETISLTSCVEKFSNMHEKHNTSVSVMIGCGLSSEVGENGIDCS